MFNLIETAYAQTAAAGQPSPVMQFVPLILIGFVFYFLILKPQKKKLQEEQKFLSDLSKDTEVFTKSGIIGTITGITDKIITLEIADGVKMKVLRSQIGGSTQGIFEKKEEKK